MAYKKKAKIRKHGRGLKKKKPPTIYSIYAIGDHKAAYGVTKSRSKALTKSKELQNLYGLRTSVLESEPGLYAAPYDKYYTEFNETKDVPYKNKYHRDLKNDVFFEGESEY